MNTHRFIARFITEAETPLFVGSGQASLITDALVQRDFNGLPMIFGTTLAGVLRHSIEDFDEDNFLIWKDIFGYQEDNKKKGQGSRLKVSNAYMMTKEIQCAEGLVENIDNDTLKKYKHLPVRQHVRINDKGFAEKGGLFDNEVVYKGTRFIFELELIGSEYDKNKWQSIIDTISHPGFRIGQGTRNGYGNLKVIKYWEKTFNLLNDFDDYTNFNPSLNNAELNFSEPKKADSIHFTEYRIYLKPDSLFFTFSSGYGDKDVDNTPLTEEIAEYTDSGILFKEKTVIPASSIKGALRHRVCFHYNKLSNIFADNDKLDKKDYIGDNNLAVFELLGGEHSGDKQRGKVIIDDIYFSDVNNEKILNHVAIDRFTGGGMDGALFSEKVSYKNDVNFEFSIFLENNEIKEKEKVEKAFENTLEDLCRGLLPLGGMTTKGNGIFVGTYYKNNEKKYEYGK